MSTSLKYCVVGLAAVDAVAEAIARIRRREQPGGGEIAVGGVAEEADAGEGIQVDQVADGGEDAQCLADLDSALAMRQRRGSLEIGISCTTMSQAPWSAIRLSVLT